MPSFCTARRLPHPAPLLYAIAADVESYPAFVPLCRSAGIFDQRLTPEGRRQFGARLDIAYPKLGIAESFESIVTCDPAARTVESRSSKPPFRHLDNLWRFRPLSDQETEVTITLDYELRSRLLQMIMTASFDLVMARVITAFEQRAQLVASGRAGPRGDVTSP